MSSNLWVGNLSADVSDLDLKNIFEKHGSVDSVTCYPLRNYAFVNFKSAEDARRAKDKLHGVVLHGLPLKIDFAKPAKPCKCLWVSGISNPIIKEDLEEAFSSFGKIEDLKILYDKNAAIIDYFKLEDAIKALKAMHGKKVGGTMIRVEYSRSHPKRSILPSEGPTWNEELPSNILCISYPPVIQLDEQMLHNALILFGEIEKIKRFPSRYCSFVEFRSMEEALRAKNGLRGKLFNDPRISITFSRNALAPSQYISGALANEIPFHSPQLDVIAQPVAPSSFRGHAIPHGVGGPVNSMRPFAHPDTNFGGPDPNFVTANGDLNWRSSPSTHMLSSPSASMNPLTKSTPGTWDVFDASQIQREPKRLRSDGHMAIKEMDSHVLPKDQVFRSVPSNTRFTRGSPNIDRADANYMWRGILAKGGTPVCCARCVPIGEWNGYEMPEIVNCSARTGLDMLAKHYADAIGFDIVFFLPDGEKDFASYTEFLQYMGDRNRAGVVKFGDGTTLFLVPPSDFLRMVLKVSGPPRLYGVVLKFPPHTSDNSSDPTISQRNVNHVQPVSTTSAIPAGLSLTPELVASLASLAKVNSSGQQPSGDATPRPLLNEKQFQGKINEHETYNLTGEFMQSNKVNDPNLVVTRNSFIQDPYFNLPHHEDAAPVTNSRFQTSQDAEFALPLQVTQQQQVDYSHDWHVMGNVVTSSSQVYNTNVHESQGMVPDQQKLEFDADKNKRYQSTLQFAANLLLQIQQKRSGTETDANH